MNEYQNLYTQSPETALPMPQPVLPEPEAKAVKEPLHFSRAERITAALMMLFGFLWIRFAVYHTSSLLTTLLYCGLITVQILFLRKSSVRFTKGEKAVFAVQYAFTLVFTVTSNHYIKAAAVLFLAVSSCLLLFHTANPEGDVLRFLPVTLFQSTFGAVFPRLDAGLRAVTSGAKTKGFWKNIGYIVIGLLIAFPMTNLAGALLCSADNNLRQLRSGMIHVPDEETFRLLLDILFGFLLGSGMFSVLLMNVRKENRLDREHCADMLKKAASMPAPIIYSAVTPLCLLYLLFFFTQLQYFLGGFTGDAGNMTYAEYARRGFFELCGVCCLNVVVIAGLHFLTRRNDGKKPLLLKIYACFLCISSLLLTDTALAKMFLYIRMYGMTQLRIFTSWFMILLAILFVLLLIRQFKENLNLGKIGTVVFTVMFALLCFSRPDAWMTRYNAEAYLSGQLTEFDSQVLSEMSDDAWAALTVYDDATVNRLLSDDAYAHFKYRTQRDFGDYAKNCNLSAWELLVYGMQHPAYA